MKVLQVTSCLSLRQGGPSRVVSDLSTFLHSAGAHVTVYSPRPAAMEAIPDLSATPYTVELFSARGGITASGYHMYRAIVSGAPFDLIHIHGLWSPVSTFTAYAARQERIPYILTPHGMLNEVCMRSSAIRKRIYAMLWEGSTIQGAARIHFMNQHEALSSHTLGWLHYPESFIAPNGVDSALRVPPAGFFRARFPHLPEGRFLLYLGRLHRIKNLELQLLALSLLVKDHPDAHWVLIGPDDGEWERLSRLATSLKLAPHVHWIGPLYGEERLAALADADVVLQTSKHECHSITVNEALAVGAPLVITPGVHFPEVEQCGAGRVAGGCPADVASAINQILTQPGCAEQMRACARRFASDHLQWPEIVQRVLRTYEAVLSERALS